MSRSWMNRHQRWPLTGVLFAVLAMLALMSPAGAAAQVIDDPPPVVTNVRAEPSSLPAEGGLVTIFADASDDGGGITWVQADVQGPYGGPETVLMGFTNVGTTWSGSLTIPANFTDQQVNYTITVMATDLSGNTTWESGGGISVDAAPQFDERPVVFDPSVSPTSLPSSGGATTIQVSASDDRAISEVYATITRPDGSTTDLPLGGISSSRFEGVFTAPANTGATAAQYTIDVTALDDIGQSASMTAGTVTVAPAPPPPNLADLKVSPTQISFPTLEVGGRASRSIVVRNAGGRSAGPISGVVAVSGASFALPGAAATGIPFTLRPGESKTINVEFRPTAPGRYTGAVTVRRTDGRQPGLAVRLSGQANPKKRGR
jgi:hypothetical protein